MAPSRLLVACISLIALLGACSPDSTTSIDSSASVDESQSVAGQQAESVVEQAWEPIRKQEVALQQEVALPIRNMPVPDEVLIQEMAAADAAAAEQQGTPSR